MKKTNLKKEKVAKKNIAGKSFRCSVCGERFDKKEKHFESSIPANIFKGWTHEILNPTKLASEKIKTKVIFKNNYWKVFAYTRVQRDIIYWFWNRCKGKEKVAYYECERCM